MRATPRVRWENKRHVPLDARRRQSVSHSRLEEASARSPLLALLAFAALAGGCGGKQGLGAVDAGTDDGASGGGAAGSSSGSVGAGGSSSGPGSAGGSGSGITPPDGGPPAATSCTVGSGCTMADGAQGSCSSCGTCIDLFAVGSLQCPVPSCSGASPGATCLLSDASPGVCCRGSCLDPFGSDKDNCGACGQGCPGSSACGNGTCTIPCTTTAGPTACGAGSTCVGGSYCAQTSCAGAVDGQACADQLGGSLCCGGSCVDPTSDPKNCGSCGVTCASGMCGSGVILDEGAFEGLTVCLPEPLSDGGSCLVKAGCPAGEVCLGNYCVTPLCNASSPPTVYCAAPDGNVGICVDAAGEPPFPCEDQGL